MKKGKKNFFSEKPYYFRAKNATVSTLRSGTDYYWLYCEFTSTHPELQNWAGGTLKQIKMIEMNSRFAKITKGPYYHLAIGLIANKYTRFVRGRPYVLSTLFPDF